MRNSLTLIGTYEVTSQNMGGGEDTLARLDG